MNTFPDSDIPLDAEPDNSWVECGTCGRKFPDLYPSARCPFEYDHEEDEGDWCMATVYDPDPQDCGDPVAGILNGTPLCEKHLAFWQWAEANQ